MDKPLFEELLESIEVITPMFVIGLGLLVGIQHALEVDHITAMSTQMLKLKHRKKQFRQLITDSITKSSILGIVWGAGHTTSLVLVGFLIYVLSITIEQQVFSGLEFLVGVMLIFLGITTVYNKKINFRHKHPHKHADGSIHFEEHNHNNSEHSHSHKSYLIGLIHGLAGSGSLVVLTAFTMYDGVDILGFIVIFGIGSIIGMSLIGGIIGIPFALGEKFSKIQKTIRYGISIFSIMIGINIMYQTNIFTLI